ARMTVVSVSLLSIMSLLNAAVPPQSVTRASIERGKTVYATRCLSCHQIDGSGVPNMNPPLVHTKWVLGNKQQLIEIVLKGMNSGVEIDDIKYQNVMASHADLSDQQIADVLTYVRNSFTNKATAVSASEVNKVRLNSK
ncbi:MAG TPA: cytochrome c, partial [Puia sp.]|nr:cytochrome c [Puia sp.]